MSDNSLLSNSESNTVPINGLLDGLYQNGEDEEPSELQMMNMANRDEPISEQNMEVIAGETHDFSAAITTSKDDEPRVPKLSQLSDIAAKKDQRCDSRTALHAERTIANTNLLKRALNATRPVPTPSMTVLHGLSHNIHCWSCMTVCAPSCHTFYDSLALREHHVMQHLHLHRHIQRQLGEPLQRSDDQSEILKLWSCCFPQTQQNDLAMLCNVQRPVTSRQPPPKTSTPTMTPSTASGGRSQLLRCNNCQTIVTQEQVQEHYLACMAKSQQLPDNPVKTGS